MLGYPPEGDGLTATADRGPWKDRTTAPRTTASSIWPRNASAATPNRGDRKRVEKAHRAAMDGKGLNRNVLIGSLVPIVLILLILFQDYLMALFR